MNHSRIFRRGNNTILLIPSIPGGTRSSRSLVVPGEREVPLDPILPPLENPVVPVPEPATLLLIGSGLTTFFARRRRPVSVSQKPFFVSFDSKWRTPTSQASIKNIGVFCRSNSGDHFAPHVRVRLLTVIIAIIAGLAAVLRTPAGLDFQALTASSNEPRMTATLPETGRRWRKCSGALQAPQRWTRAPKLTVLVSVMDYQPGGDVAYMATEERLSDADIAELVRELTDGLAILTANTFEQFSSVSREVVPVGATASVSRPDQIVIGRFNGLRRSMRTLGYGGRRTRKDGTITAGAILLDNEFDRSDARRRLLRTHELGHALGYNHVRSRPSIMNPKIGSEPNAFDHEAAVIAFRPPALAASRQAN